MFAVAFVINGQLVPVVLTPQQSLLLCVAFMACGDLDLVALALTKAVQS